MALKQQAPSAVHSISIDPLQLGGLRSQNTAESDAVMASIRDAVNKHKIIDVRFTSEKQGSPPSEPSEGRRQGGNIRSLHARQEILSDSFRGAYLTCLDPETGSIRIMRNPEALLMPGHLATALHDAASGLGADFHERMQPHTSDARRECNTVIRTRRLMGQEEMTPAYVSQLVLGKSGEMVLRELMQDVVASNDTTHDHSISILQGGAGEELPFAQMPGQSQFKLKFVSKYNCELHRGKSLITEFDTIVRIGNTYLLIDATTSAFSLREKLQKNNKQKDMQRFGAMLASIGYDVKTAHVLFQHERGGQDIDDIRGMILRDPNTQLITLPLLQHVYDFSQDIGKEFVPKP